MYDILELNKKLVPELRDIAKELKIKRVESFKKQELIYKILDTQAIQEAETKAKKPNAKSNKEHGKEERSLKNFLRKKQNKTKEVSSKAEPKNIDKRNRRERIESPSKHERIEFTPPKPETPKITGQSRQEQIKAIIQGFNLEKSKTQEQEEVKAPDTEKIQPEQSLKRESKKDHKPSKSLK
ncbi:MAG: Rho termination factor N-terminal domain-containing protein, partial [Prolixibacteraceae bacterium]|nr:Rho termination factor N-terminal domain-containing protein [Prolixibacteraceae bacterium]